MRPTTTKASPAIVFLKKPNTPPPRGRDTQTLANPRLFRNDRDATLKTIIEIPTLPGLGAGEDGATASGDDA